MPIVEAGQRLPAAYLERFDPAENVRYRMSVLSTSAVAVDFHWLDIPSKDVKGTYQCIQGLCCQAFGRRSQSYNLLIYVYRDSTSTAGDLYTWNMTPARWRKFSEFAISPGIDLMQYDVTFHSEKRGQGTDWSYSVLPDPKFRDYWSAEQKEQLKVAVDSFFQMGESSVLGNMMNYNDWASLLHDVGYDVHNQCWPGGQSPMNSGSAFQAIGHAVHAPTLPPAPAGYLPSQPAVSQVHQQGVLPQPGIIFQPTTPPAGTIPMATTGLIAPVQPSYGLTPPPGVLPAEPVITTNIPAMAPPTTTVGSVPLGTAPVMPTQQVQPQVVPNMAPVMPVQTNEVTGVQEITADELNAMLDG